RLAEPRRRLPRQRAARLRDRPDEQHRLHDEHRREKRDDAERDAPVQAAVPLHKRPVCILNRCHTLFIAAPRTRFHNRRMANAIRGFVSAGLVAAVAALLGTWLAAEGYAQAQSDKPSLAGAWTLNKDLSDKPADRGSRGSTNRGNGGFGGGRRRGGFGGRGGYGGGQPQMDPETAQRTREAMRDIVTPPEKMTITQSDSMIVMTD